MSTCSSGTRHQPSISHPLLWRVPLQSDRDIPHPQNPIRQSESHIPANSFYKAVAKKLVLPFVSQKSQIYSTSLSQLVLVDSELKAVRCRFNHGNESSSV
ncbi:hypothetical protein M431DRAFT_295761 [Trichoderma harzianum CBS 226.95]|uniref:Uncharacterized protein n=1 Tax=Trichoderma harzianum CBS 226.95 TaxID=983964 RepID=A0A2T4AQ22_TRIHA|nr:hypothetical protein M431DRAFT_295761 [Trichoderma harzianum CBS 226.95]PTB59140.1 hypothetical protein M431DRAFT_295761 [Trichoderma harzianum CBS 226.95]